MVSAYAMKGKKQKNREERHDMSKMQREPLQRTQVMVRKREKRMRMDLRLRVFQLSQVTRVILTKPGSSSFLKRHL